MSNTARRCAPLRGAQRANSRGNLRRGRRTAHLIYFFKPRFAAYSFASEAIPIRRKLCIIFSSARIQIRRRLCFIFCSARIQIRRKLCIIFSSARIQIRRKLCIIFYSARIQIRRKLCFIFCSARIQIRRKLCIIFSSARLRIWVQRHAAGHGCGASPPAIWASPPDGTFYARWSSMTARRMIF